MRKHILIKMALAAIVAGASLPAMAQSGSGGGGSGTGLSGSAGLGIDYAALTTVSGSGNPSISLPGKAAPDTLGGPITGLARHFSRAKRGN
ncbi:MAG: hypothetical protein ACREEK_01235 [Bradyrhizobium sp.]